LALVAFIPSPPCCSPSSVAIHPLLAYPDRLQARIMNDNDDIDNERSDERPATTPGRSTESGQRRTGTDSEIENEVDQ
jgi:hypothetical protein